MKGVVRTVSVRKWVHDPPLLWVHAPSYDGYHVPNFALGHNGLIIFSIFMRVCQIDAKGQIIAKEKITSFIRWGGSFGILNKGGNELCLNIRMD